jgi:hypothetical protein
MTANNWKRKFTIKSAEARDVDAMVQAKVQPFPEIQSCRSHFFTQSPSPLAIARSIPISDHER